MLENGLIDRWARKYYPLNECSGGTSLRETTTSSDPSGGASRHLWATVAQVKSAFVVLCVGICTSTVSHAYTRVSIRWMYNIHTHTYVNVIYHMLVMELTRDPEFSTIILITP